MENANPVIIEPSNLHRRKKSPTDFDDSIADEIDQLEIFDYIRCINDPEHPLTLEQLNVVSLPDVLYDSPRRLITVFYTPTIPHCSMATMIGLSIVVKLQRSFSLDQKVRVYIKEGTHVNEHAINKQLNDKERVFAAVENSHLMEALNACLRESPSLSS